MSAEKVVYPSGRSSSKIPRFDLIPRGALVRIADRFEKGQEIHKERAWNARNSDQASLTDKEWVIARANHVVDHALKLVAKLSGQMADDGDDDAAAIAWGGVFLCEAVEALNKQTE